MSTEITQTLTEQEAAEFKKLDSVINAGAKTFMDVGTALVAMHTGRLYRETFATFQAYTESRGIKRQTAYRLMEAVQLTLELEQCPPEDTHRDLVNIEVLKNSSAKAASKLKSAPKAKRLKILDVAVVASEGKPLTVAAIENATAKVTHRAKEKEEATPIYTCDPITGEVTGPIEHPDLPPDVSEVNPAPLPDFTPERFFILLATLERRANEACAGNQAERTKFGVIANAMAGRLMNPPPTTICYTR